MVVYNVNYRRYNDNSSVDFTFANQILERERLSSLTYLEKIINSIKQS